MMLLLSFKNLCSHCLEGKIYNHILTYLVLHNLPPTHCLPHLLHLPFPVLLPLWVCHVSKHTVPSPSTMPTLMFLLPAMSFPLLFTWQTLISSNVSFMKSPPGLAGSPFWAHCISLASSTTTLSFALPVTGCLRTQNPLNLSMPSLQQASINALRKDRREECISYLPQVGVVWLELVTPWVNLTCQENKITAEGEVKSWVRRERQREGGNTRKSEGNEEWNYLYFPCLSPSFTVLHSEPLASWFAPGQCNLRCGSTNVSSKNYLLPVHVDINTGIENKHWETC